MAQREEVEGSVRVEITLGLLTKRSYRKAVTQDMHQSKEDNGTEEQGGEMLRQKTERYPPWLLVSQFRS